jgi:uncharacterized damage-inducible protein DinB
MFDFHYWARDRVLGAADSLTPEQYARPLGNSFPSIQDTLNHLYLAERIWYARWHGESPATVIGTPLPDLATLRARWAEHEALMRAFVAAQTDETLASTLQYRLLNGQEGISAYWQMLLQLINHGSYHRGQVVTMLRQLGAATVPGTDLIVYFRERGAASGAA